MGSGGSAGGAFGTLFIIILLCYFIPTVVALLRKHKDTPAIAAVNILLGWSVVGWFASFIWSLSDPSGRGGSQTVVINTAQHNIAVAPPPHYGSSEPDPALLASPASVRPAAIPALHGRPADDHDTAFWDGMSDKNDPDLLEEYLIRFPDGRFAQLARNKLERMGARPADRADAGPVEPPAPVDVLAIAGPPESAACKECSTALEADARFCADCGAPVNA